MMTRTRSKTTTSTTTTTPQGLHPPRSRMARKGRWVRWRSLLLVLGTVAATADSTTRHTATVAPSSYEDPPPHDHDDRSASFHHNRTASWRVLGCTSADRSLEEEERQEHHRHLLGVAWFQCFPPPAILPSLLGWEEETTTRERGQCCQAIDRFLLHRRHNTTNNTGSSIHSAPPPSSWRGGYWEGCHRGLVTVPPVPSNRGAAASSSPAVEEDAIHPRIPSHVWMWTHPVASSAPVPTSGYRAEAGSAAADVWTCSMWDDDARQETPLEDKSKPMLPTDRDPAFRATLHSALSVSRGLHRELQHSLRVRLPNGVDSGTVDIFLLVYIPSGMFVNVYDSLDAQRSGLQLTLHTVPGAIIDEEQPEFASPGHAVFVRIQGTVERSATSSNTLEFATKVHFRYPAPVSGANSPYVRVLLPSPTLVDGTLSTTTTATTTVTTIHRLHVEPEPFLPQPPIVAWVTAGREGDLLPVLLGTVGMALVGTAIMFRSISRLVIWD